ncbi:MAG: translation initiation factor IF-2 [Rhodospirillales bacterium]|nr:translation initiation factor IF-2 [Rhodospirillales bacterium]
MTEDKSTDGKKKLGLSRPGKLELNKTVEAGHVKQSFSHGRTKAVTVEVRKKKTYAPGAGGRMTEVKAEAEAPPPAAAPVVEEATPEAPPPAPSVSDNLTSAEKEARTRALQDAMKGDDVSKMREEDTRLTAAKRREAVEARVREDEEAANAARRAAEAADEEKRQEEEKKAKEAEEARRRSEQAESAGVTAAAKLKAAENAPAEERPATPVRGRKDRVEEPARPAPAARRGEQRRRSGKLTVSQALGGGQEERSRSLAAMRRAREKQKGRMMGDAQSQQKMVRDVTLPETITVQELASRMSEKGADVIKALMKMGVMATINQSIDADTAELVATELGHNVKRVSDSDVEIGLGGGEDDADSLVSRPPVVTIMGHVDHGKTSLLDALRETDVVAGEAGGITQHIGAYQVTLQSGAKISFIDTPGHEAFTAMRARGAKVTDIVILVVAADDGVKPQTIEAIRHARAAKAPIIVAINKIDKPGADPSRVRTELLSHEIQVEEMGGDVLSIEISAKARTNLDKLEEAILLQAELLDLKANPDRPAEGAVVEARMEKGRGPVATILVQRGTLRVGDIFVAGREWGRVRALVDDHGGSVEAAGPGTPVEVIGLNGVPSAGDELVVADSEAKAREISAFRQHRERQAKAALQSRSTLEQMFDKIKEGVAQELPVVIKGDVQGSVEAIVGAIEKMATDEVKVNVLHAAVGAINESDVTLAGASQALIIGFNVRANPQARTHARRDEIDIRYYSIIYDVADDLKKMLSGMLAPTLRENLLGYAEIREVFNITKVGRVAGCMITEGVVKRGAKVRLLRDDVVIHEGELSTLQRFKDEVKEVKEGYECGMSFANYNDIQAGDMIECFEFEEIAREL